MNQATRNILQELADQYPDALPIFGCAIWVDGNLDKLISYIPHIVHEVKFRKWHESTIDAIRRFCHLCFVDPALVEAYIGMRFEQLLGV